MACSHSFKTNKRDESGMKEIQDGDSHDCEGASCLVKDLANAFTKESVIQSHLAVQLINAKDKYIRSLHILSAERKAHDSLKEELRNVIASQDKELATMKEKVKSLNKRLGDYKKLDLQKEKVEQQIVRQEALNDKLNNDVKTLTEHLNKYTDKSEGIHRCYAELQVAKLLLQEEFDQEDVKLSQTLVELNDLKHQHSKLSENVRLKKKLIADYELVYSLSDSFRTTASDSFLRLPVRCPEGNLVPQMHLGNSSPVPVLHQIKHPAPNLPGSKDGINRLNIIEKDVMPEPHKIKSVSATPKMPGSIRFQKGTMGLERFEEFGTIWIDCKLQHQIDKSDHDADVCSICCEEFSKNSVVYLNCYHKFHLKCIENWFHRQSTCPICRRPASMSSFPPLS